MNYKTLLFGVLCIIVVVGVAYKTIAPRAEEVRDADHFVSAADRQERATDSAIIEDDAEAVSEDVSAVEAVEEVHETPDTPSVPQPQPQPQPQLQLQPQPQPVPLQAPAVTGFTMADVEVHSGASSCWTVVNGAVYDLTSYIDRHPGGSKSVLQLCGKDGTADFEKEHGGESKPERMLSSLYIGDLN